MKAAVGNGRGRRPAPLEVGRGRQRQQRTKQTGFGAAAAGFVLIAALVVSASTGVFVLLDPRAQAFWGTKIGDLSAGIGALVRAVLGP